MGQAWAWGLSGWPFYYRSHNIPMTFILTFTFHKEGTETQHHGVTFSESHSQKAADRIQTKGHLPGTPFFEDRSEKRQYKEVESFENTRRCRLRSDRGPTSVLIFSPTDGSKCASPWKPKTNYYHLRESLTIHVQLLMQHSNYYTCS